MRTKVFVPCLFLVSLLLLGGCEAPSVTTQKIGSAPEKHVRHTASKSLTIVEVDEQKNEIPTGTELTVQGMTYSETWTPTTECTWLLAGRQLKVQHGELDPREYCRFSILLSKVHSDRSAAWPSASLVCHTTPEEMHRVAKAYPYGTAVRVHGVYAASLDFAVVPTPGNRFGVPVIEQCTVQAVSKEDKEAEELYDLMDKNYRDHPASK